MAHLLTPKLDYVFKRLFTEDQEILLDLVNTMLELPDSRRIQSIEVKNPTILPEQMTEKYIVLDVSAMDNSGQQFDIEMQAQKYRYYPERTAYYLCRLYGNQLMSGEEYHQLASAIGIHFLDFCQFPDGQDFHYCFQLRDGRYPALRLTSHLSVYIFELPTFEKIRKTAPWGESMAEWLHFFNHAPEEDETMAQTHYTNPTIHKAFKVLEKLSDDEETRYRAELRERALKNKNSELYAAREEGEEDGLEKGKLIGQILLLQEILKQPVSSDESLKLSTLEDLHTMLEDLKAKFTG